MPKRNADYPARIDFFSTTDMRHKLIAISYHRGMQGVFSKAARFLLADAINAYINALPAKERTKFNKILKNVVFQETAEKDQS